jgi:hypothetical protein
VTSRPIHRDTPSATAYPLVGSEVSGQERKRKGEDAEGPVTTYKLQRPRILKGDFRRHFASAWVNVFNSCDREYMMQFLSTYYEPDVALMQRDMRTGETT